MTTADATDEPLYLAGHLAPVPDEIDAVDLPVHGTLPPELTGRYLRNGPNPLPGDDPGHWFVGHGMLHGIRLADGRARWYRNRWVRTTRLAERPKKDADGNRDLTVHTANTHLVEHAGRLLALGEAGLPYEITPELATVGPCDFGGRLHTAMTAHPKQDPLTGELHFFGYSAHAPFLTYHRLTADGELAASVPVAVPGPTMMHDFAITEHHIVWLDLPVTFDKALLGTGMPFRWSDDYGARLGMMARTGGPVTWFDIEPCYVFHVGNASEDARGGITLDAVRYSRAAFLGSWSRIGGTSDLATEDRSAVLYRWTLDPATGSVTGRQLDDVPVEFPTLNDDRVGLTNSHLYAVGGRPDEPAQLIKYRTEDGSSTAHRLDPGFQPGEAVFVPAAEATAEDEGWLLTIVTHADGGASRLLVCDATTPSAPPVAAVELPRAVPAGFHGSWIPGSRLA